MRAAYGISTTKISSKVTECTIPAMGVLPPFLILAAVLAMAPVAGIPPNSADAMLPAPCATSSILERCLEFTMESATTQESRDSIPAKMAMVKASGTRDSMVFKSACGRENAGSLAEMVYKSPMVLTGRLQRTTTALLTKTAIKDAGILFKNPGRYGQAMRMTIHRAPTPSAHQLMVEIKRKSAESLSMVSISGSSVTMVRPKKSFI